jgi:hypothetical protein
LRWRKVGSVPAKADVAEQQRFLQVELLPRLEEAQRGERTVYFADAAHFVFAPFLGFLWCVCRLFVKAPPGRQRYSVVAAINAVTHEVLRVSTTGGVNAFSVGELLKLLGRSAGLAGGELDQPKRITVVLDNARYQKTWWVRLVADWYRIELLYLPGYSPNLNLIERLWKFVKAESLNSRYHGDFASFQAAIDRCLEDCSTKHRKRLASLMTLKFQTFEHVSTLAA